MNKNSKQRMTAFIDPVLMTRAKVRGALEGLTISEIVEKALEAYAPRIEKGDDQISLKFASSPFIDTLIPESSVHAKHIIPKRTKRLVVPR